ncbi:MAG: hypothetical protein ACYTER_05615 [Planctomycetota bacterium]|jgi:hypothetical protein
MNDLAETQPKTLWFKIVLFLGMLLFGFYASTHMVAAGDTWVAMACGRHFDNHGVDTVEPFSFNSHKAGPSDETLAKFPEWTHGLIRKWHPTGWLNQNWLTHLGFYKLATWFGDDGGYNLDTLVYWKFGLYFLTVFCVYGIGKTLGAGDTLSAAAACLAMVVGRTFYDIRPAGYSNLLVPAFLLILALTMCKNYRWVWLSIPLIVFWANVHGGYLYAFIMFLPFIGINLLLRLPKRWTICVGLCGLWLLLYLMSYKFISGYVSKIEYYASQLQSVLIWSDAQAASFSAAEIGKVFPYDPESISLLNNPLFWTWFALAGASVAITCFKPIKTGVYYFFHFFIGCVYFISLFPRFITTSSDRLPEYFASDASNSMITFALMYIAGAVMILLLAHKKERFLYLPTKGIVHTIGAAVASFIAMVVFNPFHLTNLTHTFEISLSKHAESWRQVNEWKPAFDWMDKTTQTANPVGDEEWFAALCVITAVILIGWLISYFVMQPRKNAPTDKRKGRQPAAAEIPGTFSWPKIDLPIILIALLTIYMAIRSRRFIPLAGAAAGPVLAMLVLQTWRMVTARISFANKGELSSKTLPPAVQQFIRIGIVAVVLVLSVVWGGTYKRIYVDPWPLDHRYNSVFMRMTASYLKPTDACQFIRDNNISGKMFNYWTEGGAVAFGQTPDPETGHVPLKLFMDGRAQAAYNHDKFKMWQSMFAGGPIIQTARQNEEKLTGEIYKQAGDWITDKLGDDVWITMMPKTQAKSVFMRALKKTGRWKTVYLDDYQHIMVNARSEKGQALINRVLAREAKFPNIYARNMTTCMAIIENKDVEQYKDLYALLNKAFNDFPSPSVISALLNIQKSVQNKTAIQKDVQSYLDDFIKNRDAYRKEDGYFQRLTSARIAAQAIKESLPAKKAHYASAAKDFLQESNSLKNHYAW